MQLTDVHLTYGFDHLDRKTFKLIDALIKSEEPDIIIVTGDLFMTLFAKSVFKKFIKFIDSYDIPWSITFGNHEMEFHSMESIVTILLNEKTNNLYFTLNSKLEPGSKHGYSNFKLEIYKELEEDKDPKVDKPKKVLNIYLLDSKQNRLDGIKDSRNPYDNISKEQVDWYSEHVKKDRNTKIFDIYAYAIKTIFRI